MAIDLTWQERAALTKRYRSLHSSSLNWKRHAGRDYDSWAHLFVLDEAAMHNVVSREIIRLVAELVLLVETTPDSEVVLPAEIRKRLSDLDAKVLQFFDLSTTTHKLEIRDTRPSTLPEDPELGGK